MGRSSSAAQSFVIALGSHTHTQYHVWVCEGAEKPEGTVGCHPSRTFSDFRRSWTNRERVEKEDTERGSSITYQSIGTRRGGGGTAWLQPSKTIRGQSPHPPHVRSSLFISAASSSHPSSSFSLSCSRLSPFSFYSTPLSHPFSIRLALPPPSPPLLSLHCSPSSLQRRLQQRSSTDSSVCLYTSESTSGGRKTLTF